MRNLAILTTALLLSTGSSRAQTGGPWNNRPCAVVLTYDDAIDEHLDAAIPALDSLRLRGTFYLIGSSPVVKNRLSEWRQAAGRGHELGNHSLMHPCDGSLPGRSFVIPDNDLSRYSLSRAVSEVRATNTLLTALDGQTSRTYAFPCGDRQIGGVSFYDQLKADFVGARGVNAGLQTSAQVDLSNINAYGINGESAAYLIDLVKQAQHKRTLLVFLFHGVGGGHPLNVDLSAHRQLLRYLKAHEQEIWVTPLVEVAQTIKAQQQVALPKKPR